MRTMTDLEQIRSVVQSSSVAAVLRAAAQRAREYGELNAFVTLADERSQAEQVKKISRFAGRLHGVPIAVKDNIDTADMPTTGATPALRASLPGRDHQAVARLRAAGATVVGKTNMHELAF